jgi:hypothetical protein
MCASCGYNLTGQPVMRESHYQLLIVRCPECATVASVQEYPLLGRWANRWATFLAALWLLMLVIFWAGLGVALFGLAMGTSFTASEKFGEFLSIRFSEANAAQQLTAAAAQGGLPGGTPPATMPRPVIWSAGNFQAWWKGADHAALFNQAGGWAGAVEWRALLIWIPLGLAATLVGMFWAVVLLGRHRLSLLMWGGIEMLAVCACSIFAMTMWQWDDPRWMWDAAIQIVAPRIMIMSLCFTAIMLAIGLMIGRPVVRRLICLLLAPRARGALTGLWIADGLEPPSVKR